MKKSNNVYNFHNPNGKEETYKILVKFFSKLIHNDIVKNEQSGK